MTQKKTTQKTNRRFKPGSHSSSPRFCYLWIWIALFFVAIQYVSGLHRPMFNYGNFTNSASSRARFRRDTSKLDNAVRNLGHLARVTNGIALEIGLVDGSIKPGEAVSELLLMGDLQLDDIISLNHDSIEKVLTAMSQKIQTNQQVEKLEQRLMSLEDVREISPKLQDLNQIPGLKEFETSFKAVEELATHKANFTGIQHQVNGFVLRLDYLENMAKVGFTEKSRRSALSNIGLLYFDIEELQDLQAYFGLVKKLIDEAKKMSDNSKFIEYLATENKFRTSEAVDYTTLKPLLLKNFEKVREDFQAASDSQKEFDTILRLIQTRSPLHRQTFKHTAGFPRGSDDLKDLELSIEDPSIISRISNGESVKTDLKAAFESFKNLEKEIDGISSDWKGLEAQYNSIYEVVSTVINLGKLPDVSQSITGIVDKLVECDKGGYPTSKFDEDLPPLIQRLCNKVTLLGSFDHLERFPNLDDLKEAFDAYGLPNDEEERFITNAFNILKTDKRLQPLAANLKKMQTEVKYLMDFLDDPYRNIKLAGVTLHLTNIDKQEYTTFLKCVKDIQVEGFPVRDLTKFIRDSRNITVTEEVKDVISNITQSGSSLKRAQSLAGKFKGDGKLTPKVEVLKASFEKKNYEEVSRKLGMGVQGLAAILKVRTAEIDGLLDMTEKILDAAETDGLSPKHQKSLQQLREVKQSSDSVYKFVKDSKSLQADRRKRNAGFQSFHKILREAANVHGVKFDLKSLQEAMEVLNEGRPYPDEAMNALKTLETLDLDFEKFKIKDAIPSLIAMDRFFQKYFAYLSGSIQVSEPGNSLTTSFPGQIVETAPMDSLEEDTLDKRRILVTLISICVGVCFVVTTVTLGIWCWKCKPKKSAAPSKSSKFALVTYPKAPGDAPEVPKRFDYTQESSKTIHVIKELIRMHHCDDDLKNQLHRGISPENRTYGLHESFWIPRKSEKWYEAGSIDKPEDNREKTRKLISCHIRTTVETHKCNKEFIEDKLLYVGRHPSDGTEKEQDDIREEQWSMGSDNNVSVVVLLCDKEEKSAEYFPSSSGRNQDNGMKCDSFSVITKAITERLFTLCDVAATDTNSIQTKKLDVMECVEWSAKWNKQLATKCEDPRKCEDSEKEKEKSGGKNTEHRSVKNSMATESVSGMQLHFSQQMRRWKEGGGEKK